MGAVFKVWTDYGRVGGTEYLQSHFEHVFFSITDICRAFNTAYVTWTVDLNSE